jgi:hypothetical protein
MKISKFNPVKNAEIAREVTIKDPSTDAEIEGLTFKLKGFLSQAFRLTNESLPEIESAGEAPEEGATKAVKAKYEAAVEKHKNETITRGATLIAALITEFPALEFDDDTKVTANNLVDFLISEPWMTTQLEQFIMDLSNYSAKM